MLHVVKTCEFFFSFFFYEALTALEKENLAQF